MKFFGMGNIGNDVDGVGTDNVEVDMDVYEIGIDAVDIVLGVDKVGNCILDDIVGNIFTDGVSFP